MSGRPAPSPRRLRHAVTFLVLALALATGLPVGALAVDNPGVTLAETPSVAPSLDPSPPASVAPSPDPSLTPSVAPSPDPGPTPSLDPSPPPSVAPSLDPSPTPSSSPTPSLSPPAKPLARVAGALEDEHGRTWVRADIDGQVTIEVEAPAGDPRPQTRVQLASGDGWSLPNGDSGPSVPIAWSAGATYATFSVVAIGPDQQVSEPVVLDVYADVSPPQAALDPLAIEEGQLTVRWTESDSWGPGIGARTARLEMAPLAADGCGAYTLIGGEALGQGDYSPGAVDLGPPPPSGCLRASIELIDLFGLSSLGFTDPLVITPPPPPPPPSADSPKPTTPTWAGKVNVYRSGAFVSQKTFKWCVAASIQMMVNIVRNTSDRSTATQRLIIDYAQTMDNGPWGVGGGTDTTGWTAALGRFGAGRYRVVGASSAAEALRIAATAIRLTGRPVGLLVMRGRHAWVLTGFESKTDPKLDRGARIASVRVSGPLYPRPRAHGYDRRPNTRMTVAELTARYYHPVGGGRMMSGKYVVIIPIR